MERFSRKNKKEVNNTNTEIGALVLTALVLTGAMGTAGLASAELQEANKQLIERYENAKQLYQNAIQAYLKARYDFGVAVQVWKATLAENDLETALSLGKLLLGWADNAMMRCLEFVEARVEITAALTENEKSEMISELSAHINWLQAKQPEIEAVDNVSELISLGREIQTQWRDSIRVDAKRILGEVVSASLNLVSTRAETIASIVEAKIENLENQGVDTTHLRELLDDYNSKISSAQEKSEQAREKFSQMENSENPDELFSEGVVLIKESIWYLRMAYTRLREMVAEIRSGGHEIELADTGALIASGTGQANITVTGTVEIRAIIGGTMIVSSDAIVKAVGQGTKTTLPDNQVQYEGFGSAIVVGTDITVEISGSGIDLIVAGEWTATLSGSGWYRAYTDTSTEGQWAEEGTFVVSVGD